MTGTALAEEPRPRADGAMPFAVYCRREFDGQNSAVRPYPVRKADNTIIECNTGNLSATGNTRKNDNGLWLIGLRDGSREIEVIADHVGAPSREDADLTGKLFTVTGVEYRDWLGMRVAPSPYSAFVHGIARLQDDLRATGKVADWNGSRWIEVEFIVNLGAAKLGATSQASQAPEELIFENTRTVLGWINANYVTETRVEPPVDVANNSFFGNGNTVLDAEGSGTAKLIEPFGYRGKEGRYWRVPAGYVTNGASIPSYLWSVVGSPLHETHRVFYDAMTANGFSKFSANLMYFAVYRFGPRWMEQRVQCLFACAEGGEVAAVLTPEFDKEDMLKGERVASNADVSIEELERLADQQLANPNAKVSLESTTLSITGNQQQHTLTSVRVEDLKKNEALGFWSRDELLNGQASEKMRAAMPEESLSGPLR